MKAGDEKSEKYIPANKYGNEQVSHFIQQSKNGKETLKSSTGKPATATELTQQQAGDGTLSPSNLKFDMVEIQWVFIKLGRALREEVFKGFACKQ